MNANIFGDGFTPLFGVTANQRDLMGYFVYAAAIAIVTAIVVLWLVGLRGSRKRSRRRHRTQRSSRRRDRTRDEADGLPPVRGDESASTEHYQR